MLCGLCIVGNQYVYLSVCLGKQWLQVGCREKHTHLLTSLVQITLVDIFILEYEFSIKSYSQLYKQTLLF